ncbi:lytic transglycosylase domain-containing protein [Nocardioides plantarum]|uniref:Lytic transglycosylase domain-containing protein n=1 Tax=Nocardioides plantarum TaxID=29299 RepID=A0ABV5K8U8_9ACTN|nr:lytic murein transglycosylase [Nocardioides plantarum]
MSTSRFSRVQRAVAIVPLALLSAAWTASLTNTASPLPGVSAAADRTDGATLPDGTSVPTQAIEAPASVSSSDDLTGSVGGPGVRGDAKQIVATSSTNGIPSAALAAYQRAETVINAADASCHLKWQLVAAIGRVESDHGRYDGNALNASGVAKPGIYGPALNGKAKTSLIRDTDAGQYDKDKAYDRAVGPMQFIPSTWSVVGVDADNDGVRNPQDIDDAALATAVYLCSGTDDLATLPGQRASVFRYNHSKAYVDLVLSIMDAYLDGDFTSVPNDTRAAGYLEPDPTYIPPKTPGGSGNNGGGSTSSGGGTGSSSGGGGGGTQPPSNDPTDDPDDQPTNEPSEGPTNTPTSVPSLPLPSIDVPTLPPTGIDPVDEVLTRAQAILQCTLDGKIDNPLRNDDPFDKCVKDYMTKG